VSSYSICGVTRADSGVPEGLPFDSLVGAFYLLLFPFISESIAHTPLVGADPVFHYFPILCSIKSFVANNEFEKDILVRSKDKGFMMLVIYLSLLYFLPALWRRSRPAAVCANEMAEPQCQPTFAINHRDYSLSAR
jgi:hypothetical protein